jgi:hypothetical protein
VVGCGQPTNWSQRIVSRRKRPLASFINPHVSAVNVLIVDGKRFDRVRGVEKFYLHLPQINSIIFVVDEKDYSVNYHVYKLDTKEDITIHARGSIFGRSIGSTKPQDAVEPMSDGKVVLSTRSGPNTLTQTLIYLDLAKKAVVREKTLFFDQAGNVIREHEASPPL